MGRIAGILADSEDFNASIADQLIYAAAAQNYAGEKSCGIAVCVDNKIRQMKGRGLVSSVFGEFEPKDFAGKSGIVHNASKTDGIQPIVIRKGKKQIAFCADATLEVTRRIISIVDGRLDIEDAISQVMLEVEEPFALLALTSENIMIAARNNGRKPLSFGRLKGDICGYYVASQSGVMGPDAEFIHSIFPGEMLVMRDGQAQRRAILQKVDITRCFDELLFVQRPGNKCGGQEVGYVRELIGEKLGQLFREKALAAGSDLDDFIAVQIPDGGLHYLIGFGRTSGILIDPCAIVKNRYPRPNWLPANIHFSPIRDVIDGKKVILVDDLIRSGQKMRDVARLCLKNGAKSINGVAARTITHPCPFGNGAYIDQNLIGRKSFSQIEKKLEVESLLVLTNRELIEVINLPHRIYCTECM